MNNQVIGLLITVAIFIVVMLVIRRLAWWYWGIDKHLTNQQEIINTLKAQIELQQILANQEAARRLRQSEEPQPSPEPPSPSRPNPLTRK